MKKFKVVTLGCKVNSYESEAVANIFESNGYVRSEKDADVIIINTCSVTSTSDSKSRQKIRHEIKDNPNAIVCVMGCYSQVNAEEASKIDGVSIVIGTKYRSSLYELVKDNHITFCIDGAMRGVGGDMPGCAHLHKEYRLNSHKKIEFEFRISKK